jgi:hypothetical protein
LLVAESFLGGGRAAVACGNMVDRTMDVKFLLARTIIGHNVTARRAGDSHGHAALILNQE